MGDVFIALQIYGMGIIIAFLVAVMIKALLFFIRYFERDKNSEKA